MSTNQIQTNWPLQKPQQLVYVELGPDNGGMVLGICEQGLSFRAVAPLKDEGPVYFTFAIDGKTRLNGAGEIAWSEDGGKSGGLKFTNISQQFRETLHAWLASEAKPKAIGREGTPAAAPPVDSLSTPKSSALSTDATSVEEAKPPVASSDPIETAHAAPKPVIPAPDAPRSTSPASIVEAKPPETSPVEPKLVETKPVEHTRPERVTHGVEAAVSTPAPPQKIEPKPAETEPENVKPEQRKPEPSKQEPVKSQSVKPVEAPPVEPVANEPELRSAVPLPPDEIQPQPQHVFSLPGFRLPSAPIDAPHAEIVDPPKPRAAKPEPAVIEPPVPQAPPPPPSMEQWHVEEPEPRRLIPPPANPEPWEFPDMREADEEDAWEESPRMNRAFASGIVGIAMAVLLAALVLGFRREVGEVLIRVGEALSGEGRNQVVQQQPPQTAVPAQATSPRTQKASEQPTSQTANTGNAPQSASSVPPQAVNANPAN